MIIFNSTKEKRALVCGGARGGTSTTHPHLLQVAVHGGGGGLRLGEVKGQGCDTTGLDFLTRKSLSSSDGEMTHGETMEEILEESEFWPSENSN